MKRKKGFTLPEVVIALSITIIVMSLVASLIVIVSKISAGQNAKNEYETEYRTANTLVDEFLNSYNTQNFEIETFEENKITIENSASNHYVLMFEQSTKKLSADIVNHQNQEVQTKTLEFSKLVEIKFTKNGNIILCEYVFDNDVTYKNLITFGV